MDTGGYGFVDEAAHGAHHHQIELAMAQAQLVLFWWHAGRPTSADQGNASLLRRKGIKSGAGGQQDRRPQGRRGMGDFARAGLGTPSACSALTRPQPRPSARRHPAEHRPVRRRRRGARSTDAGGDRRASATPARARSSTPSTRCTRGTATASSSRNCGHARDSWTSASRRTARRWW